MSTTLSVSTPVARKQHQCGWCHEMIEKGEKYHKWFGVFEGYRCTSKMHMECQNAFVEEDHQEDGYIPGEHMRGSTCEIGCRCPEHLKKSSV